MRGTRTQSLGASSLKTSRVCKGYVRSVKTSKRRDLARLQLYIPQE